MRKLTLNLDSLLVESFEATNAPNDGGTVNAHLRPPPEVEYTVPCLFTDNSCNYGTCDVSCAGTCGASCAFSCGGSCDISCGQTCAYTCDLCVPTDNPVARCYAPTDPPLVTG